MQSIPAYSITLVNLYFTNSTSKNSQEIIESKEKTINSLQTKLDFYESSVNKIIHNNMCIE